MLELRAKRVICTDPHIADPSFLPLDRVLAEADVLFVGAPHKEYRGLKTAKPIVDVFDFLSREAR